MIDETLRVLEYDRVRSVLVGYTVTAPGRRRAEELSPLQERSQVVDSLERVSEMVLLCAERGRPPVGSGCDLQEHLLRLKAEGTFLSASALLEVRLSIEAARDCRRYLSNAPKAPGLSALGEDLESLPELYATLRQSIGERGDILDGASFELGEVRRDIQQQRSRIKRALEAMLSSEQYAGAFQDNLVTERGGRYVVPVRADRRGQVKGFIHDESASGQTLFVEPERVLEGNNELQILLREEKREEERILRRLSSVIRRSADELAGNQRLLAEIDFLGAAARFSQAVDGVAPRLADAPLIALRQARHPLLLLEADGTPRGQKTVPVDLMLGEGSTTLVISGPNTGGKTVALKTMGLLVLMVRSGLHIPCQGESSIHPFARVFADIGDEQSIEANLSTFSGHLLRLRRILEQADSDSLVLIDEAGTGTDPAEGGALAMAVLDDLRGRGARAVVTTHLNLVKSYAFLREGVENAAVEFDSVTLEPTYRLHYGIPGASSAFTIARCLGLPAAVLERAEGYLGEGEREGLEIIEELNRLRVEQQETLAEARRLQQQARQERARRKELLDEVESRKQDLYEKARRRADGMVRQAEERLRSLFREAQELGPRQKERARLAGELKQVRSDLVSLREEPSRKGPVPQETRVGEILRIPALDTEGEVVRVLRGAVELSVRGKKLRQPLKALEQLVPRRFAAAAGAQNVRGNVTRERMESRLLLVGKRVDEAVPLLERFIDDALLHGLRQVEIVHGAGEGILRRVVREALAGHREVTAFYAAAIEFGGENVTVVELKG